MLNKFATGDNSMSTPSMGPISEKRNDVVNNTGCVYKVRMWLVAFKSRMHDTTVIQNGRTNQLMTDAKLF